MPDGQETQHARQTFVNELVVHEISHNRVRDESATETTAEQIYEKLGLQVAICAVSYAENCYVGKGVGPCVRVCAVDPS